WMIQAPYGLGGSLSAQFVAAPAGPDKLGLGVVVQSPDLSRGGPDGKGRQAEGPLTLAGRGTYQPGADRLDLDSPVVAPRYGTLDVKGRLDEPAGRRLADLQGTLAPSWPALSALAAAAVEPKLRLEGGSRPFRVKGPLSGGSLAALLKGLDAE